MELSATHCRNAHAPCSLPAARSLGAIVFLAAAVLLAPLAGPRVVRAAEGGPGENADIEIGGPGSGPGQFLELRDLAFGPEGRLYVLEGRRLDNQSKQWVGNCRVQVFDETATFLEQFPIADARLNEKHDPSRLAVDAAGRVFVAEAASGLVLEYRGRPSKLAHVYEVPGAFALCTWKTGGKQRIVVVPRRREQNQWVPIDELPVIDPAQGKLVEPLRLARGVAGVMDAEADPRGNLFLLGEVNQLYKFDASGRLLAVLGSGTWRRLADGSELRHSVALDAQGRIYSQAWGRIARFEPDLKSVALRVGQFYWYDNWSPHDAPTPIAIDRHGRFWLGAPGHTPRGVRHHYRPCVTRAKADFFEKLRLESTLALGFDPKIETGLPYNVAYELTPIELTYVVPQANRRIGEVVVDYRVLGVAKAEAAKGSFALKLEDGVEARQVFRFTPRRYGWYTVECAARTKGGEPVLAVGAHVGVTPRFNGMSVLAEGDSPGGWVDPAKQAFCGLRLMRLHVGQGLDLIDKTLDEARRLGLTVVVQFENRDHCTPEKVREAVTRLKGRARYWEIINEPNFSMNPQQYVELLKQVCPIIKGIDPSAQIMGPTVCGINLAWYEEVFQAGGGPLLDIISVHDYEGNESIDPGHWRFKIGELRKLMARYQLGNKPIWQTERAIGGVRAKTFLGGVHMDQNLAVVEFPAVTTDRLRMVARRSTLGFHPDEVAVEATGWQAGGPSLHLREIEVFGPPPAVEVAARLAEPVKSAAFAREPVAVEVTNRSDRPVEAVVRVVAPEGFLIEPAETPLTVDAGASRGATLQLVPPSNIPTGKVPLDVMLVDKAGKPLDYRRVVLAVEPPVEIAPLAPPALDDQRQPLVLEVKNRTDRPLSGVVRLRLEGGPAKEPVEGTFESLAPGDATRVELVVPELKLGGAAWRALFEVTAENLVTRAKQDFGKTRLYQVVGPFANAAGKGFDTVYEPERRVDLRAKLTVPGGQAAWRPATNDARGFVDLTKVYGGLQQVCAYAVIYVKSPVARKATFSAGSDDGIKAWLNGRLVVSHDVTRGASPGQEQAAVELRAGWNEILLKITQDHSGWGFYLDLSDPDGQPLADLIYAPRPGR